MRAVMVILRDSELIWRHQKPPPPRDHTHGRHGPVVEAVSQGLSPEVGDEINARRWLQ